MTSTVGTTAAPPSMPTGTATGLPPALPTTGGGASTTTTGATTQFAPPVETMPIGKSIPAPTALGGGAADPMQAIITSLSSLSTTISQLIAQLQGSSVGGTTGGGATSPVQQTPVQQAPVQQTAVAGAGGDPVVQKTDPVVPKGGGAVLGASGGGATAPSDALSSVLAALSQMVQQLEALIEQFLGTGAAGGGPTQTSPKSLVGGADGVVQQSPVQDAKHGILGGVDVDQKGAVAGANGGGLTVKDQSAGAGKDPVVQKGGDVAGAKGDPVQQTPPKGGKVGGEHGGKAKPPVQQTPPKGGGTPPKVGGEKGDPVPPKGDPVVPKDPKPPVQQETPPSEGTPPTQVGGENGPPVQQTPPKGGIDPIVQQAPPKGTDVGGESGPPVQQSPVQQVPTQVGGAGGGPSIILTSNDDGSNKALHDDSVALVGEHGNSVQFWGDPHITTTFGGKQESFTIGSGPGSVTLKDGIKVSWDTKGVLADHLTITEADGKTHEGVSAFDGTSSEKIATGLGAGDLHELAMALRNYRGAMDKPLTPVDGKPAK